MRRCLCLLSFVLCLTAGASHIEETIRLSKGWNAIYLESTSDAPACADFFAGSPVASVGCYSSDAYESTVQYRSDGTEINQKPVTYSVWFADEEEGSSVRALFGGRCYLIYATNAWSKTFLGIPAQPHMTWRKADTNGDGFMNLAGVSCATDGGEATAASYFGLGPFGAKGTAYQIGGLSESAPAFLPLSFGSKITLKHGMAYALTAGRADDWPGVIRIGGTGAFGLVDFDTTARRASFTVANASATDRTFALTCRPSADAAETPLKLSRLAHANPLDAGEWIPIANDEPWTLDLKAGESATVQLAIDRAGMTANAAHGSVIEVRDEGGSQMRVRIPLTASVDPDESRTAGLWVGAVQLTHVSQMTNETPVAAQGTMKLTALLHVGANGTVTLLPEAAVAADTNQQTRLYATLSDVPTRLASGARRITGGMMSLENAGVTGDVTGAEFGKFVHFAYEVAAGARDNPFRHAWHPDHANTGSDGIAVSNDIQFVWKEGMGSCAEAAYLERDDSWLRSPDAPDGVTAGYVVWKMTGLAKGTVTSVGRFALQRVVVGELEGKENEK